MPISGPVVHQQLLDAYSQTQTRLEALRSQIGRADAHRERLADDRGDALVELAQHYLPELTGDAIRQTWREVQPAIGEVLRRKEHECLRLDDQLRAVTDRRHREDSALLSINKELDEGTEAQQELASRIELHLQQDEGFMGLSDRAALAEAALERAEANLQEIDQDAARKLPAYQQSTLFTYLRDRGYGTSQYKFRGFTRRMDRWVARLVDYNKAKQGYDFLRNTPEQMREIIAADRQSLDAVMDELERRRDQVANQQGLPAKIEATTALRKRRDDQLQSAAELQRQTDDVQKQLTQASDSRGPYYTEAIGLFRGMLEEFDSDDLTRRAKATIDLSDDLIVSRLIDVESKLDDASDAAQYRRQDVAKMQAFLEDLGRMIQQFRSAGFDSSRSQFVGTLDVAAHLNRAIQAGDAELLWNEIRNAQRWGPTAMEQFTAVATHPMTQVLINAMAHAAGGALQEHARRAGRRRFRNDGPWGGPRW